MERVDYLLSRTRVDANGCLRWLGATDKNGYGRIRKDKKLTTAHRAIWELLKGKLPREIDVCHTCDNRLCVNPKHLWLGTRSDNMLDCSKKGRFNRKKKSLIHGTSYAYQTKLCRCFKCREWKSIKARIYNQKKKEGMSISAFDFRFK